jgi:hypothetical protein
MNWLDMERMGAKFVDLTREKRHELVVKLRYQLLNSTDVHVDVVDLTARQAGGRDRTCCEPVAGLGRETKARRFLGALLFCFDCQALVRVTSVNGV